MPICSLFHSNIMWMCIKLIYNTFINFHIRNVHIQNIMGKNYMCVYICKCMYM